MQNAAVDSTLFWHSFGLTLRSKQHFTPTILESVHPQAIDVLNFSLELCSPILDTCPATCLWGNKNYDSTKILHIRVLWRMRDSNLPVLLRTVEASPRFLPNQNLPASRQKQNIALVAQVVCEWMLCEKPSEMFPANLLSGNTYADRKKNHRIRLLHHICLSCIQRWR